MELVVSMALLMLVLAFAAQLVVEAGRTFRASDHRSRLPEPAWAAERLRHDLRQARHAEGPGEIWMSAPLSLVLPDGRRLRWRVRSDGHLVREVELGSGWVARSELREVRWLRWRRLPRGLVELELVYRAGELSWERQIGGPLPEAPPDGTRAMRLVVSPRGAGRSAGW